MRDGNGFVGRSLTLADAIAEPEDLAATLALLAVPPAAQVVIGGEIASEANIAWLSAQGYRIWSSAAPTRCALFSGVCARSTATPADAVKSL